MSGRGKGGGNFDPRENATAPRRKGSVDQTRGKLTSGPPPKDGKPVVIKVTGRKQSFLASNGSQKGESGALSTAGPGPAQQVPPGDRTGNAKGTVVFSGMDFQHYQDGQIPSLTLTASSRTGDPPVHVEPPTKPTTPNNTPTPNPTTTNNTNNFLNLSFIEKKNEFNNKIVNW